MLLKNGLIISYPISVGHSRIKVLSLTELGKSALGIDEPDSDRLGGPEHRYWKKRLAEHLRSQGWEVVEEYPLGGGKAIDLLATRDGKRVAIEVETGKADAASNVRKCLAAGLDEVFVVVTAVQRRDALAEKFKAHLSVKVVTGIDVTRLPRKEPFRTLILPPPGGATG